MGTHPIFESDFDCLTEMSDIEGPNVIESESESENEQQEPEVDSLEDDPDDDMDLAAIIANIPMKTEPQDEDDRTEELDENDEAPKDGEMGRNLRALLREKRMQQ